MLVQGQAPREALLTRFRELGNAVLLATGSFWEGVDVKGEALSIVAIDKLPFASPDDPLLAARLEGIRRRGGNPFTEYQLPQAVLALKQGVGRLIRDFDDFGVIVIGDPRLRTKSYGRVFLAALPPSPIVTDAAAAARFLAERLSQRAPHGRRRGAGELEPMRILALDASTEACSAALLLDGRPARTVRGAGARARRTQILGMVEECWPRRAWPWPSLDGIAAGIGPGAFTGVRISVSVAQGLAFGAELRVAPVTTLEALAAPAMRAARIAVLACLDARMGEVYWGCFRADAAARSRRRGPPRVGAAEHRASARGGRAIGASGAVSPPTRSSPRSRASRSRRRMRCACPAPRTIARLGAHTVRARRIGRSGAVEPLYLRDKVALTEAERGVPSAPGARGARVSWNCHIRSL